MHTPIKHLPVNWTDGMKLSKKHFIESEHAFYDMLRDTAAMHITAYNFGLLPVASDGIQSVSLEIRKGAIHSRFVQIIVRTCHAITIGGIRMDVHADSYSEEIVYNYLFSDEHLGLTDPGRKEPGWFYVVLSVHPFERIPTGTPAAEETPLRHPYITKKYTLDIVPAEQVSTKKLGMYHLVIGKIIQEGETFTVDDQYIPPCTTVSSHTRLVAYHQRLGDLLNQLQVNSLKIIAKVHAHSHHAVLAKNIHLLCSGLLDVLAHSYFSYRNTDRERPPVVMLGHFSTMANKLNLLINCLPRKEKEELLSYFYEWSGVMPNNFEGLLSACINMVYDHYQINHSMVQVDQFLEMITSLWEKLGSLEYLEKRKDNLIVTEKNVAQEMVSVKKSWSILD